VLFPDLINKAATAVKKYSMLSGGEKILTALSGGPDSVCLLYVLYNMKDKFALDLHAIYIDHGLRPGETDMETAFCQNMCEKLSIPFVTRSVDVKTHARGQKMNVQEAARQLRYKVFDEVSHEIGAGKIALGHTADDQAETLLMRLFRGSGPTGLSGIPPVRKNIIRPLIEIERKEIEKFLDDRKIDFIIDSSNKKKDYLRNKIRLSLIPMLREFNPDIIRTLSKTASIFRDEEKYFEILATKTLMKLISRKTDSHVELFLIPFESMETVLIRRVLRRIIDETKGLRGISFVHIEDIIGLIKRGKPGDRIYLPKGIRVIKEYSILQLTSEPPAILNTYNLTIPGETVLKEAGVLINASIAEARDASASGHLAYSALFDADKLTLPLTARPRENGDFFFPSGFGKRKKIQDFFVDEKVARDERGKIPIITSGEDIIWVLGYRSDDRFKVTEETKKILKLEVKVIRDY
jgi:tRNA(Ile)-lysidine synthase